MNYFYYFTGDLPNYLKISINSLLTVEEEAKIYLCSDDNPKYKNIDYLNPLDFQSSITKEFIDLDIYKNTAYEKNLNPLWSSSILRIFAISDFLKYTQLNETVHFDADVIVYKPFEDLKNCLSNDAINITKLSVDRLIFGYSFIQNFKIIEKVCIEIIEYFKSDNYLDNEYYKNHPLNEMEVLSKIQQKLPMLFKLLPDLPYGNQGTIFDPAGYGQYLGGTFNNPKKWYKRKQPILDHSVGQEISSNRISVGFKANAPTVSYKEKKIPIANLHIHSKDLFKFKPKNYREFI